MTTKQYVVPERYVLPKNIGWEGAIKSQYLLSSTYKDYLSVLKERDNIKYALSEEDWTKVVKILPIQCGLLNISHDDLDEETIVELIQTIIPKTPSYINNKIKYNKLIAKIWGNI